MFAALGPLLPELKKRHEAVMVEIQRHPIPKDWDERIDKVCNHYDEQARKCAEVVYEATKHINNRDTVMGLFGTRRQGALTLHEPVIWQRIYDTDSLQSNPKRKKAK